MMQLLCNNGEAVTKRKEVNLQIQNTAGFFFNLMEQIHEYCGWISTKVDELSFLPTTFHT